MNTDVMFSSKDQTWETPQNLFNKLDKEFNYDIYEYNCTVNEQVQKLEIQKEAYEYND